jgi:nondiscriminating glutamyl-tRNA synthetase
MDKQIRTRFAPSPTGYLHIGGLRTALYNKLFALHHGGVFFLRIEDTDQKRLVPGAGESLIRTLAWAGIEVDEGPYLNENGEVKERGDFGPYVQSRRLDLYRRYADELVASGHAYPCFCGADRLDAVRKAQSLNKQPETYDRLCRDVAPAEAARRVDAGEPHVIRFRIPTEGRTELDDLVRSRVSFENSLLDDLVIMKTDGFPTYHLAHVVDDHLMETTHVLRAEEWLPSAPKHVLMFQALGWEPPAYGHLPQLLNPDRTKLSKRQGDVAVEDYRDKGYLPEALVNFIALMGWNPTADREVFTLAEMSELFDIHKVNKAGAVLNREKLDWLNREYLKALPSEKLVELALPFLQRAGVVEDRGGEGIFRADGKLVPQDLLAKFLSLEQARVSTLAELPAAISCFLDDEYPLDPAILPWRKSTVPEAKERLVAVADVVESMPTEAWSSTETVSVPVMSLIKEREWGNGDTLWPMRVALTGRAASPSPFEAAWALGRDETSRRLRRAISILP